MKLDAVFFDFDGVLVDSVYIKEKTFGSLYFEYGEEVVKKVMEYHRSNGGVSRFDKFRHYHNVFLGKELLPEDLENLNKGFSKLVTQLVINASEIPGTEHTLLSLYQQIPLHVISATPEAELEEIIIARKMRHFFCSIHGSPKKKHEHIINIIQQQGYERQKVIMVGDTMADYESSLEAAVNFIGYVPLQGCHSFPENVPIISDIRLLIGLL